MEKSPDAFRTISEVSEFLETPAHVLRFWESRFPQIKPVKRAGGRRYYRPADVALLQGIKRLLHEDGMTIRGVQKILREQGVKQVSGMADDTLAEDDDAALELALADLMGPADPTPPPSREEAETAQVIALQTALRKADEEAAKPAEGVVAPFVAPIRPVASPVAPSVAPPVARSAWQDDGIGDLFGRLSAGPSDAADRPPAPPTFEPDPDPVEEAPMALWAEAEPEGADIQSFADSVREPSPDPESFDSESPDPEAQDSSIPPKAAPDAPLPEEDGAPDTTDAPLDSAEEHVESPAFVTEAVPPAPRRSAAQRGAATLDFPNAALRNLSQQALSDKDRQELAELLQWAREIRMALTANPRAPR